MLISTATPGVAAISELTASGFPWVFPQRSNQTISVAFRRPNSTQVVATRDYAAVRLANELAFDESQEVDL